MNQQSGRTPSRHCRTCLRCRSKKVKCDNDRPKCTPCASSGSDCTYPPDARRSARASKADIQAMRNELLILRSLVHENGINYHSKNDPEDLNSVNDSRTANVGGREGQEPIPHTSPRSQPLEALRNSGSHHDQSLGHLAEVASHLSPRSVPEQQTQYERSPPQPTPQNHRPLIVSPSDVENNGPLYESPLLSEAHIAGAMTEDGQVHVHGVTSTLHQPAAVGAIVDIQDEFEKEDHEQARTKTEYLIFNAAIQRQKEIAALSSTNVAFQIDFDGVDPDLAIHLLDLHWNRHHLGYMYTYRPAVMDSLINGGPYANKLLLNAIYYASSLFSDRPSVRSDPHDPLTQGDRFYRRFKQLLIDEIDIPSIASACALLLCGSSLVSFGKQSAGWLLCGLAYRMITDLGCHLDVQVHSIDNKEASRSHLIESETRRRLYWGAFVMDKFQSLYLGRPPALRPAEARVSKILHDTYEELELWSPYIDQSTTASGFNLLPYQPKPTFAVSTFQSLVALAEICHRIMGSFYSLKSVRMPSDICMTEKASIEHDLNEWQTHLAQHLRFDPSATPTPPQHQITPHTTYWTLIILLERPFLSTGHLRLASDASSQIIGAQKCSTAVMNIWNLVKAYKDAFSLRRAPYLLSYAIYSAVLVILHQTDGDNTKFSECLPDFWAALQDLQHGCNTGLKKPIAILKALMLRHGKDMAYLNSAEEEYRIDGDNELDFGEDDIAFNLDFLQSTDYTMSTKFPWLDSMNGDPGLMEDSMFGLFTSR